MARPRRLIILAAGQGTRLRPLTEDRPKCLVNLAGRSLLQWQIDTAQACGVDEIFVVGGYRVEQLRSYDVCVVENPDFASTNMVRTLFCARDFFGGGFILSYGDIVYSEAILRTALNADSNIGVIVDCDWRAYWDMRFADPLSDAESLRIDANGNIASIGQKTETIEEIEGQYIGMVRFFADGVDSLNEAYDRAKEDDQEARFCFGRVDGLDGMYVTDLLQGMIDMGCGLRALPVRGGWLEVDSPSDLKVAMDLVSAGRLENHG